MFRGSHFLATQKFDPGLLFQLPEFGQAGLPGFTRNLRYTSQQSLGFSNLCHDSRDVLLLSGHCSASLDAL